MSRKLSGTRYQAKSCDVVIDVPIVHVFLVPERRNALWQSISDHCLCDFAVLLALMSSETLLGRVVYLLKWPMLTREVAIYVHRRPWRLARP